MQEFDEIVAEQVGPVEVDVPEDIVDRIEYLMWTASRQGWPQARCLGEARREVASWERMAEPADQAPASPTWRDRLIGAAILLMALVVIALFLLLGKDIVQALLS